MSSWKDGSNIRAPIQFPIINGGLQQTVAPALRDLTNPFLTSSGVATSRAPCSGHPARLYLK